MKTISLGLPIAAAMLFLAPGLRAVESTTAPASTAPAAPDRDERRAEYVRRFDKNGDGKLDQAERTEAKSTMKQERSAKAERRQKNLLKRYDKNGDGKLDEAEKAAAFDDVASRPRFIKRHDKDGDGKLSPEEKAAAKAALKDRFLDDSADSASSGSPSSR
jgi:Ca2+-binding EF-hand superfamily protein